MSHSNLGNLSNLSDASNNGTVLHAVANHQNATLPGGDPGLLVRWGLAPENSTNPVGDAIKHVAYAIDERLEPGAAATIAVVFPISLCMLIGFCICGHALYRSVRDQGFKRMLTFGILEPRPSGSSADLEPDAQQDGLSLVDRRSTPGSEFDTDAPPTLQL